MLTGVLVPGNRWDLLGPHPAPVPDITVIVTHYEQHHLLPRMAAALSRQTVRPVQVILADDGSATTPEFDLVDIETSVVRQDDRGFRAAAARNLAARESIGEVLVFLDADTVPEPGFLAALTSRIARCPDVLAVGRRRYARFAELDEHEAPDDTRALPEPAWLSDAYRESGNLLRCDGRSFRFVISAVLACRRDLFRDLGGFDERFVEYGGEDWDFAYRAWNNGAVFVHEPHAVAWHDGPDWAGRDEDAEVMDHQSARLAALIPEPVTRGAAMPGSVPDVLATVHPTANFADTVRIVHSLLRQTHRDMAIRLSTSDQRLADTYRGIVRDEPWTPDQSRRARVHLSVHGPLPPTTVERAVDLVTASDLGRVDLVSGGEPVGTALSTRLIGRARRWSPWLTQDELNVLAFGRARLVMTPPGRRSETLEGFFAAVDTHRGPHHPDEHTTVMYTAIPPKETTEPTIEVAR